MSAQGALPGFEEGRRVERVEFGLRRTRDGVFARRGHIDQRDSAESAADTRDRPFSGWDGDEEIVTRTVVTYTTGWTVVPGHEGSRWLSCWHHGTPQGRQGEGALAPQGPDYQIPHAFRERDMLPAEDGVRRYTCPVCGTVWRPRTGPERPPAAAGGISFGGDGSLWSPGPDGKDNLTMGITEPGPA